MSRPNFANSFDSFPERERRNKGNRKSEGGYVLLVLLLFSTLLFISLGAAIPNTLRMGQREREEELLFRGRQYMRAIDLYFRQFGRYPATVDELLKTDNMRFLRRAYKDPMTRKGKWRFIHADASGRVVDSTTSPAPPGPESSGRGFGSPLSSAQSTRTRTSAQTTEEQRGRQPRSLWIFTLQAPITWEWECIRRPVHCRRRKPQQAEIHPSVERKDSLR